MALRVTPQQSDSLIALALRRGGTVSPPRQAVGTLPVVLTIPLRLPSLANMRWHWSKMAREKKRQRKAIEAALVGVELPALPVTVRLTRCGPKILDQDNLVGCWKAVIDTLAAAYGIDDGASRFSWEYRQEKGKYGVEVRITPDRKG